MMPEEARNLLSGETTMWNSSPLWAALETIAALRVEECGRVLTMKETGGGHQVKTTYRLVGEWQDKHE